MFRALPGALLPGIDPDALTSVTPAPEGESPPAPPAAPNGRVPTADALASGFERTARQGGLGADAATPAHRAKHLDGGRPAPAAPPSSDPSGRFLLGGDPIPLAEWGLVALPHSVTQGQLDRSPYVLEEAVAGARAAAVLAERARPAPTGTPATSAHPGFDATAVRDEFPVLAQRVHGRPLVWLDNGATTQKPEVVIDRLDRFYRTENSNIHRGAHALATRATDAYEDARAQVARFLHAPASQEIVFVRGTTEAINLVAQSWGRAHLGYGDEILITWLEHHANIVPWHQLCQATGARLCVAPVDDSGQVMLDEYERLLSDRTRLVAFTHVSNVLGTVTPAREMTELAHRHGARVLIDGAQAVPHMAVDVQELDSDWYAFSGHKVFGPTGIGVLHGKRDLLDAMPPWQGGGNMIRDVTFERSLYQPAPARFEAGTSSIADAVGLGAALDYLQRIGMHNVARHEQELLAEATAGLADIPGLQLIGTAPDKAAVLSFVLDGLTPEAVGEALDRAGVAVRAGHHCAQPIVRRFGHEGTVRATFALYNTREDVHALVAALRQIATRSSSSTSQRARGWS